MKRLFALNVLALQLFTFSVFAVDSPDLFLGYELGSRFTSHSRVVAYFEYVSKVSARVQLIEYGKTWEGRPLLAAVVSSEKNMANLDEIRMNNLRRAGLEAGTPRDDGMAIIWLSYNVHGNEPSSTETAMKVLYALASDDAENSSEWLKNTIVIIDPCLNPDGRERYTNWYRQVTSKIPDPRIESAEHLEPWPGGRFNHYLFDLNRDWTWLTQRESRDRVRLYHQWMPHVHIDFHEQWINNNYYFAPAAPPYHQSITPWQRTFQELAAENNAVYFQRNGWLFFTKESFDLYYPGFGDTYPMFNGAIGMTYEVPGNTRAGLAVITAGGDTLTLKDRIQRHYATSMATIEVTSKQAEKLTEQFTKYFKDAANQKDEPIYLIRNTSTYKISRLTELLDLHRIQYAYCKGGNTLTGKDYATGKEKKITTGKNDLVIDTRQPASRLIHVLFDAYSLPSDSLTYDITAWSLPFAYGLKTWIIKEMPEIRASKDTLSAKIPENNQVYAFLVPWKDLESVRLLAGLLSHNVKVRKAGKPVTFKGRLYREGSLIITRNDNKTLNGWPDEVRQLIVKHHFAVNAIEASADILKANIGSGYHSIIAKPEIALAFGKGTYPAGCGEIWYFFEREICFPVSRIPAKNLADADLSKYDILIFPDGRYQGLLGDNGFKNIDRWVRKGGRLILFEGAVDSFTGKDKYALKRFKSDGNPYDSLTGHSVYRDSDREYLTDLASGCLINVQLDPTNPLAYGYNESYISLHTDRTLYETLKEGWNVGYTGKYPKVISGFAGSEFRKHLPDKLIFGVEEAGSGEVIYLLDDLLFRSFWENGKLMFSNALFM